MIGNALIANGLDMKTASSDMQHAIIALPVTFEPMTSVFDVPQQLQHIFNVFVNWTFKYQHNSHMFISFLTNLPSSIFCLDKQLNYYKETLVTPTFKTLCFNSLPIGIVYLIWHSKVQSPIDFQLFVLSTSYISHLETCIFIFIVIPLQLQILFTAQLLLFFETLLLHVQSRYLSCRNISS